MHSRALRLMVGKSELSQSAQDSLSRADTALQSIPVSTSSVPGAICLFGELAGTSQASTMPGLADKASISRTNESGDVDGLAPALARFGNIRAWFRGGSGAPPASIAVDR